MMHVHPTTEQCIIRSADGGRTWSPPRVFMGGGQCAVAGLKRDGTMLFVTHRQELVPYAARDLLVDGVRRGGRHPHRRFACRRSGRKRGQPATETIALADAERRHRDLAVRQPGGRLGGAGLGRRGSRLAASPSGVACTGAPARVSDRAGRRRSGIAGAGAGSRFDSGGFGRWRPLMGVFAAWLRRIRPAERVWPSMSGASSRPQPGSWSDSFARRWRSGTAGGICGPCAPPTRVGPGARRDREDVWGYP